MWNCKKQFFIFVLFVSVVPLTFGGRTSSRTNGSRTSGSKSTSHTGSSHTGSSHIGSSHIGSSHIGSSHTGTSSYPSYHPSHNSGSSQTGYGWKLNTGGNNYNSGHYYNPPPASSSYNSPSYHPPQNAFGSYHPVSTGIAPSYHFHRSTGYYPLYIPSSRTYVHHHPTQTDRSSTTANNTPPPPPPEPVVYKADSFGESEKPTMIVGFNNMIVYGVFENEKHYVITVSEDLDDNMDDIPEHFLHTEESSLFDIVTLKPPRATTTQATTKMNMTTMSGNWTTNWRNQSAPKVSTTIDKDAIKSEISRSDDGYVTRTSDGDKVDNGDALNLHFGDIIL